jgi:ribosome-binding protein aMBF1 (putative translation factor)
MDERDGWAELRDRRLAEPGVEEAFDATRLAYELGKAVREMREWRGWTQAQPAVARVEAGGTVPTIPVLERLAHALGAELVVRLTPRAA